MFFFCFVSAETRTLLTSCCVEWDIVIVVSKSGSILRRRIFALFLLLLYRRQSRSWPSDGSCRHKQKISLNQLIIGMCWRHPTSGRASSTDKTVTCALLPMSSKWSERVLILAVNYNLLWAIMCCCLRDSEWGCFFPFWTIYVQFESSTLFVRNKKLKWMLATRESVLRFRDTMWILDQTLIFLLASKAGRK